MQIVNGGDLLRMLAEAGGRETEDRTKLPPNQDIIARTLRDMLLHWDVPCPYVPGDLVVPRENNSNWHRNLGVGIVTRLLPEGSHYQVPGSPHILVRCDMALLLNREQRFQEIQVASRDFELYTGEVA